MNEGLLPTEHEEQRRREAERKLMQVAPSDVDEKSPEEIKQLIHELQVHQVELKMQQEELQEATHALRVSEARYRHLYQFAPNGYFTVNAQGGIDEINFAAARLLGLDRRLVTGKLLRNFIRADCRAGFDDFFSGLRHLHDPQRCELVLHQVPNEEACTVALEGVRLDEDPAGHTRFLITALDITERKRLERENQQQQQALLHAILEAQEEERRRISESLHNGVGQILYAAKLNLARINLGQTPLPVAELQVARQQTEQLLSDAIKETRNVSHELIPLLLKERGLAVAVADFCQRFAQSGIVLSCHGLEERLDPHLETAIYRIAQELLNNIVKHAGATRARLEVFREGGNIVIEAQDNGKGMAPEEGGKGIGLKTIRDRVSLLAGILLIDSRPGRGTLVTVSLPVGNK